MNLNNKMNLLFNEPDLLYNVMLQCNYNNIILINKLTVKISNNQQLWKEKLDDQILKSLNYKKEYISINKAFLKAKIMTKVILKLNENERLYLCTDKKCISSKDYNFYWIDNTDNKKISFDVNNRYIMHQGIEKIYDGIEFIEDIEDVYLNKNQFIDFFTKLFYHYPEIYVEDIYDIPFIYNVIDLNLYKNTPDNELSRRQRRIKYWCYFTAKNL